MFFDIYQATENTLKWPQLIDTVNASYPLAAARVVAPDAVHIGTEWRNVPEGWLSGEVTEPESPVPHSIVQEAAETPHWIAAVCSTMAWIADTAHGTAKFRKT